MDNDRYVKIVDTGAAQIGVVTAALPASRVVTLALTVTASSRASIGAQNAPLCRRVTAAESISRPLARQVYLFTLYIFIYKVLIQASHGAMWLWNKLSK